MEKKVKARAGAKYVGTKVQIFLMDELWQKAALPYSIRWNEFPIENLQG